MLRPSRLLAAAAALLLAACATPREPMTPANIPYTPSPEAQSGPLASAERALMQNDAGALREALAHVNTQALTPDQLLQLQILQAELSILENRALQALQLLPRSDSIADADTAARVEATRAKALFQLGDTLAAVHALVEREKHLGVGAQIDDNRERIWQALRGADLDVLGQRAHPDSITQGWIDLARISRSVWPDTESLHASLDDWKRRYPGHPGAARAEEVYAERLVAQSGAAQPGRAREFGSVALLLPLTGPYAATAEAVRDGLFAAYYAAPEPRPKLRVYDAGAVNETALAAYSQAISDGADLVIGPLRKESVAALAAMGTPSVPLLALNYLDAGASAPRGLYQFGLAPEDEARQAAEAAASERRLHAVALVPAGDWGTRVLAAFTQRLQELGGVVVSSQSYGADVHDFGEPMQDLLALDASRERDDALSRILGTKLEYEPRRRDDIDVIFVGARADQARLILPQLRFHRASGLPVYATAAAWDGQNAGDDLNGLRICDGPFMLDTGTPYAALRESLRAAFPSRPPDYARLLAMGYDAYGLAALIATGRYSAGQLVPGATGTLEMGADGAIHRGMGCAQVSNGVLQPLVPRTAARP